MRIDTIYSNKAAVQASFTVGRGHVNGIYVITQGDGTRCTVRLRSKNGTVVLVPNMELTKMLYLTDYFFGATTYAPALGAHAKMYRIDLGSIYLSEGDEIQFDFTNVGDNFLQVSTYSEQRSPYELIVYEEIKDKNFSVSRCQAIFTDFSAIDPTIDFFDYDVSYKVNDSDDTFMADQIAVATASSILGRLEEPTVKHGLLWSNPMNIPESVNVQITGTHADSVVFIVIRKMYPQGPVSANTVTESKKFVERVRKLEKADPETAKALRHAQVIPAKADEMEQGLRQVEHAQALDDLSRK